MATYVDAAGPTGAPAAVIHPDNALPSTWRVLWTWDAQGARGAWLEADSNSYRDEIAQVVYDESEPLRKPGNLSATIAGAAALLRCDSYVGVRSTYERYASKGARERLAYYAERDIDIRAFDRDAWLRYRRAGKPGPESPYSYDPSPPPAPVLADDKTLASLIQCEGLADVVRTFAFQVHPDTAWPTDVLRVTIDGQDWACEVPAGYDWAHIVPVTIGDRGKLYTERGFKAAFGNYHRQMSNREYAFRSGTATPKAAPRPTPGSVSPARQSAAERVVAPLPDRGVERAKWLGEQVTGMASAESSAYPAHVRRRIAAHRALAIVSGYEPADPENDGMTLYGTLSLHLAGLNEMARRAFDGENGDSDALL